MKKTSIILISLLCFLCISFSLSSQTHAAEGDKGIKVHVTTKIPWANCEPTKAKEASTAPIDSKYWYDCYVKPGFSGATGILKALIQYATFLVGLIWVGFIVFEGIMYSTAGISEEAASEAKKRLTNVITWLIVLLMSGYILYIIAPWVYKLG
jgi:lysylphosphatidylglycerol synthetase-like protein (DUF2156 family)